MTISNDRPAYRILAIHGFFGPDDHLYQLGDEIYFDDEPNEEMEPLNESARKRLGEYLNKLDNLAKIAAEKLNKAYVGRPRTLDGAIAFASEMERDKVTIMSAKKDVSSVGKIEQEDVPEVGSSQPKRGRGRPVGSGKKAPALSIASAG